MNGNFTKKLLKFIFTLSLGLLINSFSLSAQSCDVPVGLNVNTVSNFSVTLNWDFNSGATQYRVRYQKSGETSWTNIHNIMLAQTELNNLTLNSDYFWQVKSYCDISSGINSSWSVVDTFSTTNYVTDCNNTPNGIAFTDSCGNCVGGTTGAVGCIDFTPSVSITLSSSECNIPVDIIFITSQDANEPDISSIVFTSDAGQFDFTGLSINDVIGSSTIIAGGGYFNVNTTLMVDFIISADKILVKAVDDLTGQIYGSFAIENDNGGILVVATSLPDNNNVTSGNSQTILVNGLFVNPDANVLNFTSTINSELGDVDNQSSIETIECLDCDGILGGTSFTDSCGNCVGGSTGNVACIPFSPTVSVSLSNTDCDSLSDLSISVSQDPNEPDMSTALFASNSGFFDILSMNVSDIIGTAVMSAGSPTVNFNTNLIVSSIISSNQVIIQSQDINTGLILGTFTITNLNPGVSITANSVPDNNNVTSGNSQTVIFTNVFVNPGAGVLTFTSTVNSEIGDQDIQNFPFIIACLCIPNGSTDVVTACNSYTWIDGVTYTASNNTATHTLTNAGGCDSTVTLNLTINYSNTGASSVTACYDYNWDGVVYTISGEYVEIFTNSAGCDSAHTLTLTINNSTTSTTDVTECDSYTWNGTTYTTSGVYTYSTTNSDGCDSIATLNLTINNFNTGTSTQFACEEFDWNGQVIATSGSYDQTFTNASGCDSVHTLVATIEYTNTGTSTQFACDEFIWNGQSITTSGSYDQTFTNVSGCDSVHTLVATIGYANTGTSTQFACDEFIWNGQSITISGSYDQTFTNASGCDSVHTLVATIEYTNTGTSTQFACDEFIWNSQSITTSGSYDQTFTNASGCDSVHTLVATIGYANTSTSTVTACDSYTWNGLNYTLSGLYTYSTINADGCDSTAALYLTINGSTTSTINTTSCGGYMFNGSVYWQSGVYTYITTNAAGCDSIVTLNLTINNATSSSNGGVYCDSYDWNGTTYTSSGVYSFHTTNAAGCDSTATLALVIFNSTTSTTDVTIPNTYTWNGTNYTSSGVYTWLGTNAVGCDSTATLNLTILTCDAPLNPVTNTILLDRATMTWDAVADADHYEIRFKQVGDPTWQYLNNYSNSRTKTNLSSATSYHWQVRTHCDASAFNISEWTDTIVFQTMTACANTTNLSDSIVGLDFATLTWDNDPNVWAYRIRYRKTGSWIFDTTYTNTITVSGLDNSSVYNWQIKSMCDPNGINSAIWTSNHQFTTLTPCADPSVLLVDSVGLNEAYLSWTVPSATDHFIVLYSELGSGIWNSTITVNTNIVLTGLATYAPYEWSVLAFCEATGLNNSDTISGNNFVTANPCTPPAGMFSSNILLDRFKMNWNAVALADHYEIRFKEQGTAIWQMITNISNTHKTKFNLSSGTNYEWEVRSICDASGTSYSDWSATQTQATLTPCVTPLNPASANVTLTTADLSWDNDPSVWGYRVRYRVSGSWIFDTTYTNSISLTGLSTGSNYNWQVKAMCDANGINSSTWTGTQNFTTITPCANPFNLVVNQIGLTSARFVMSGPNSPDHYYLLYRVSGTSSWDTITLSGADISGTYASKVVTGLTPATTYEWKSQVSCQADDSNLSNLVAGTNFTTVTPCATPSNLASSVTGEDVTFSWDAVAGSVFYTLKFKQIGGSTGWQTVSNFTNSTYTVNNLGFGVSYQWIVSSTCDQSGINVSPFSAADTVSTDGCPDPQNIGVTDIQTTQVKIYWDSNSDIHHFAARARVAGTTIWTKNIQAIFGNNRTVTGLNDGTIYEFQVRSVCFNDTSSVSAWSSLQTFTTLANCNAKPSALTTSNITLTSADLSFAGTPNAVKYLVRFKTVAGAWNTWVYDTLLAPTVSLSKTSLIPGTQYIWAVRAVCDLVGANSSGWANQALFSTLTPCQNPNNLTVVVNQTTTSTLKLRWTAVWNTYGYKLAFKEDGSATWDTLLVANNTITNVTALPFGVAGNITANSGNIDVVLSGLNAGTSYSWQVMTVCEASGINNSSYVNGPDATTTEPCATPSGLSTTAIGANNATLNWSSTATAYYYALRGRVAGTTTWTINPSTIYGTSKTIYGLAAGEAYEWQVRSVCSNDTSEVSAWSAIQLFNTMVNCDNAPTNPTEIAILLNEATLTWDIQPNAQAYVVRFRKLSEPWSSNVYTTITTNSITKTGLLSDADYTWDLRAICDTVNGIKSPWTGFRIFHTEVPCPTPLATAVRANYTTLTGASVKFYGPNNTDYLVMFKETTAPDFDTVIVNGTVVTNVTLLPFGMTVTSNQVATEQRVFFTGLSPTTEYEWEVIAACSHLNLSTSVSGPNFTTLNPCQTPSGLSSSVLTDNATISWSAVTDATFYNFRKRLQGSSTWSNAGTAYGTSRTIWNLTPGASYEWQVRSQCDYSETNISDWSTFETFTTQEVCTKPTNPAAINITNTTANLVWDAIPGAWGYRLMYLENGAAWNTKVVDTINTNLDAITSLNPGTTYKWRVKGICDASGQNNSPWKGWQFFSTLSSNRITAGDVDLGENLNVYPNPTDGVFNISFISEEIDNFEITIIDAFGKLVSKEEKQNFIGEYTKQVNLSRYPRGIYMVQIKTEDSFVSKRIVLQ